MHYTTYFTEDTKAQIMADAEEFARTESDSGYYHGQMTFHDTNIYPCEEDAINAIKEMDNGWYDDHCVRFRDISQVKPSKEMEKISERISELRKEKADFEKSSFESFRNFKSALITCKKCNSKINKDYISRGCCPVCRSDMRSPTVLKRLGTYDSRIKFFEDKFHREKIEHSKTKSSPIRWIAKVEVHC